jgi:hypothetical protein
MFTAFTVQVCQLLEGHIRPGDKGASRAVRTTEQEVHKRPPLNPQFIHTHETPFARSVANQCAVLHIHLAKSCSKQGRFTRVHRMPFVPMPRDCLVLVAIERAAFADHERPDTAGFRLPAKSIARFLDFTEQPGSLHFAYRRQLG